MATDTVLLTQKVNVVDTENGVDKPLRGKTSIAVNNLSVRYDQSIACQNINFAAYPGDRIAIIGPNGAGKSSLFKAIVGLQSMHAGTISINGQDCQKSHNLVGYVPQHEAVDWQFPANVWDVTMMARTRHIGYFLPPRKRDRKAVRRALEQVEMWPLHDRQIGELSGGQRRRVFIARALAQEAKVLLMDEPFAGVDATVEAEIFRVFDLLRNYDVTLIVATHNLGQAATHYDKILMLNREQVAYGPPQQVYTPQNLQRTFGGYLTLIDSDTENQTIVVSDDPCHHHDC
jgi:ABC-type Mn2+/Zn2+ transport system ATPase subunit